MFGNIDYASERCAQQVWLKLVNRWNVTVLRLVFYYLFFLRFLSQPSSHNDASNRLFNDLCVSVGLIRSAQNTVLQKVDYLQLSIYSKTLLNQSVFESE